MDARSQDNISSWFIRRSLSAGADKPAAGGGKRRKDAGEGKQAKQQEQQPAAKRDQQAAGQQKPAPAKRGATGSGAGEEKASHPLGLVVAVADRAKAAVKTAAAAGDAAEERQRAAAAAAPAAVPQQQQQQRASEGQASAGPSAAAPEPKTKKEGDASSGGAAASAGASRGNGKGQGSGAAGLQSEQEAARRAAAEEEAQDEVEDRPRVVAYSDSDSDVESHIQRVKHHLLPSNEDEEAANTAAAASSAAAAAEAATAAAAAEARRRALVRRLGRASSRAGGALAQHLSPSLALHAGGMLALGRVAPRAAAALSVLAVAAPVVGAAVGCTGADLSAALPPAMRTVGHELGQCGRAAVVIAAARALHASLQHRRQRRQRRRSLQAAAEGAAGIVVLPEGSPERKQHGTPSQLLRRRSSVNLAALGACADLGVAIQLRQPQTAAEWAGVYAAELAELRRMLQENQVELPSDRFDPTHAELLRFCKACGLLTAKTAEQRAAALEGGFSRLVHTAEWVSQQRFLSDKELRRWERLVTWKTHDASGRPILLVRLGRAQQLVKLERYDELAAAVLTLVHRGLTSQLSNAPGGADQMVVVLDCRGGSSMGLTRHMAMLKRLAVTLNQHYPDRLFKLHLLELPLLLRWALHGVMPLLHPATRQKVVLSSINDPDLAVTVAFLTKRRSSAGKPTMRRTMSNCSFLSSGDSTPMPLSPLTAPPSTAPTPLTPSRLGDRQLSGAAAAAACIEAPPPSLSAHVQPRPGVDGQAVVPGLGQLAEEDVPHTPPPTLKAPQSPREPARARRQLQGPAPRAQGDQALAGGARAELAQPWTLEHQERDGWDGQQQPQDGGAALHTPPRLGATPDGRAVCAPPSPFCHTHQQQQQQQVRWAEPSGPRQAGPVQGAGSASSAGAAPSPAPAAGSAARSAAAVPSSHAVPWSPGMQSTGGDLSRGSSSGELELVPAAAEMAASDMVRQLGAQQAQLAGWAAYTSAGPPAGHASQAGGSTNGGAVRYPGGSTGSLLSLAAIWAALLPSRWGSSGQPPALASTPPRLPQGGSPSPRPSGGASDGSGAGGFPRRLVSTPRRGGLKDLPARSPVRSVAGQRLTPRKSSLRRCESADALAASGARELGSHPLRRQSSVSWAQELEVVKEIALPDGAACPALPWHGSPLRVRLAAAGQQQLLLTLVFVVLAAALLAHRLGLTAAL